MRTLRQAVAGVSFWRTALCLAGAWILSSAPAWPAPLFEEVHTLSQGTPAVERAFDIATSASYDVILTDFATPQAFTSLRLIVTRGDQIVASLAAAGAVQFNGDTGSYRVHVVGVPNSASGSGTFGVSVRPTGSTTSIFDFADAMNAPGVPADPTITTLHTQFSVAVPGTYQLLLTDFGFPAPLSVLTLNILAPGGTSVFAVPPAGPGTYFFGASAGAYELFIVTKVATPPDSGSYGVEISDGTHTVYADARAVSRQTTAVSPGSTFAGDVVTPGQYRLTLTDFQFPALLQSLQLNVSQGGASLGTLTSPGTLDVSLAGGRVFVSVVAQPAPVPANGLYGVELVSTAGGTPLIEVTQASGALFDARAVDVPLAGSYDVTLTDLQFPVAFSDLKLAVTRGGTGSPVGYVFGGGTFSFNAPAPGRYFLNFIAAPDAAAKVGTYGLSVRPTPPAPVVTLTALSTSVLSGGTSTLSWSAADATACIASGAWTGTRAVAGTETTAALTADSTFTLTCTGAGGSGSKTVTVTIAPPASSGSGGGGALGWAGLLELLLLLAWRRHRGHSLYMRAASRRSRSGAV